MDTVHIGSDIITTDGSGASSGREETSEDRDSGRLSCGESVGAIGVCV